MGVFLFVHITTTDVYKVGKFVAIQPIRNSNRLMPISRKIFLDIGATPNRCV